MNDQIYDLARCQKQKRVFFGNRIQAAMFIRAGDFVMHVLIDGPPGAAPLVLLHSLGTNAHLWDAQAVELSKSFRVIRPDLRGHGLSSCTPGPYRVDLLAADLAAMLDALEIEQCHLGGISLGGLVAQAFAATWPQRTESLILVATAMAIPPAQTWTERAATVRAQGIQAIEETAIGRWVTDVAGPAAGFLRTMLLRTPAEGYAGAAEAIAAADLTPSTSQLQLPALVVVGDQDRATPVVAAQALHQAIAGSSLVILPGAAHIPMTEQPEALSAAMQNFLSPGVTDYFEAGMAVRRQVLGEAHLARAAAVITDLDRDFQAFITRTAWGSVWTRPGLDRRTRSLLTIAMMASLGHEEELKLHLRASRNTGCGQADITEVLLQVAVYAGIPAANSALRIAKEIFREIDP
jgi:3-oxoadipate enol-lactonase / 4-carboxymuconolactone decarboxylase